MCSVADHLPDMLVVLPGAHLPGGDASVWGSKAWNLYALSMPVWQCRRRSCCPRRGRGASLMHRVRTYDECWRMASLGSKSRRVSVSHQLGDLCLCRCAPEALCRCQACSETVLDVGLNATTVDGMLRLTGTPGWRGTVIAASCRTMRRSVAGLPAAPFQTLLTREVTRKGASSERELTIGIYEQSLWRCWNAMQELAARRFPANRWSSLCRRRLPCSFLDAPKAVSVPSMNGYPTRREPGDRRNMMVFAMPARDRGRRRLPAILRLAHVSCTSTSASKAKGTGRIRPAHADG